MFSTMFNMLLLMLMEFTGEEGRVELVCTVSSSAVVAVAALVASPVKSFVARAVLVAVAARAHTAGNGKIINQSTNSV